MGRKKRIIDPVVTSIKIDKNVLLRAKSKAAMQRRSLNDVINYYLCGYISDTPPVVKKRKLSAEEATTIEAEARAEVAATFGKMKGCERHG